MPYISIDEAMMCLAVQALADQGMLEGLPKDATVTQVRQTATGRRSARFWISYQTKPEDDDGTQG